MTRKDFELIAAVLKAQRPFAQTDDEKEMLRAIVRQFADELRLTNKQFNRDRFIHACGWTHAAIY